MGTENMKLSRRTFVRSSALLAAASAAGPVMSGAVAEGVGEQLTEAGGKPSSIRLGLDSYTFRNFTRAQMLVFLKQLNVTGLNPKDTKDHLPMDPAAQAQAVADYAANGIHLHAAGTI